MTVPRPPAPPGFVPNDDELPAAPLPPWMVMCTAVAYGGACALYSKPGVEKDCKSDGAAAAPAAGAWIATIAATPSAA